MLHTTGTPTLLVLSTSSKFALLSAQNVVLLLNACETKRSLCWRRRRLVVHVCLQENERAKNGKSEPAVLRFILDQAVVLRGWK